jgi:glutamyl-tRNA reductase
MELAQRFNASSIPFEHFRREMAEADIVLCSTGAAHYLIGVEDVRQAIHRRKNRPIFLIDISVPRNIDPAVKDIDNAFLFDIDDLELRVEKNLEERRREAVKAEQMVDEEVDAALQWLKSLEVTPTIVAMRSRAEEIRQAEVEKALARLSNLSPQERSVIEGLASGIVNKLLHGSLVALKAEANAGSRAAFIEAARQFYELDGMAAPADPDPSALTSGKQERREP